MYLWMCLDVALKESCDNLVEFCGCQHLYSISSLCVTKWGRLCASDIKMTSRHIKPTNKMPWKAPCIILHPPAACFQRRLSMEGSFRNRFRLASKHSSGSQPFPRTTWRSIQD